MTRCDKGRGEGRVIELHMRLSWYCAWKQCEARGPLFDTAPSAIARLRCPRCGSFVKPSFQASDTVHGVLERLWVAEQRLRKIEDIFDRFAELRDEMEKFGGGALTFADELDELMEGWLQLLPWDDENADWWSWLWWEGAELPAQVDSK